MSANLIESAHRFERLFRYLVAGGLVTLVYSLILVALVRSGLGDPAWAAAIAWLVTLPLSFTAHRRITYADVASGASQRQRFAVVAVTNLAIATATMKLVDGAGWPYWVALVIGWVLIPIANYVIMAIWVFRARRLFSLDRPHTGQLSGAASAASASNEGAPASGSRIR